MDWNGTFNSAQFREAVKDCMDIVATYKLRYWLANSSKIDLIQPEDQTWTSKVLLPGLSEMGVKKVAIIIPENLYNHMAIAAIMVHGKEDTTFDFQYFVKKEEAINWFSQSASSDVAQQEEKMH